ncbi:MAG: GNAT family N-acetyltransferase/peptidase C39 family protein [Gammaproteobacteria bacterium]|nr:GNAT family N-acetyltransferase/peptidase C39 family protein [Gammaproteobacteria bacterium]MDH5727684.1 GNAT family N-acetyltransferase/peptidase C39 family protein [Gammaproteobacteria bacterium]
MKKQSNNAQFYIRGAEIADMDRLLMIENHCFDSDRLSRRSFRHFLTKGHAEIRVAVVDENVVAYVLIMFHSGTSLSRLYSIAVLADYQRKGIAQALVDAAEKLTLDHECVSLRLEIRDDNRASIRLFESLGYKQFGRYLKYYEDDADAVRLEKRLMNESQAHLTTVPYYQQSLDFTCGPASLMMAMKALDQHIELSRTLELRLWREATTIFMTSGLGGCGPYGMALAAYHRGFKVSVYVKQGAALFIDSVRSTEKKEVIQLVEQDFIQEIRKVGIPVFYHHLSVDEVTQILDDGGLVLVLISSYRIYKEKFPHWIIATGHDDRFLYFHDPYIDEEKGKTVTDCINMPISKTEFARMTRYGKSGQHAAVVLHSIAPVRRF